MLNRITLSQSKRQISWNKYNLSQVLSVLVSVYSPHINGVYVLSVDFKLVLKSYYMLEKECNQCDSWIGNETLKLFNTMATQVLLSRVKVWVGTILFNARDEIQKIQNVFMETTGS